MPAPRKLKVYRTPIGFHDAYVAAPSQKAAMAAWGSDRDLFTRGEAELVTDEALTAEPLARPGVVIKRLRGTAAEQLAALPPDKTRPAKAPEPERRPKSPAKAAKPPAPRPSRDAIDAAEQALAELEDRQKSERRALAEREAELARERRALEKSHAAALDRATRERDKVAAMFERAMEKWRG